MNVNVSLCIATSCRPEQLRLVLDDVARQHRPPGELIVVDNDPGGSARPAVQRLRDSGAAFPIHYEIQPAKNMALARNRAVAMAKGDWIAFIEDDERAPPAWLGQLAAAVTDHAADGVIGPVIPVVPLDAPGWIRRGPFHERARMKTGTVVPPGHLRFGNLLLRTRLLRPDGPFNAAYGRTGGEGGEGGELLARLVQSGARIIWCDEAAVREPVEVTRLTLRCLMLRALRGGQDIGRHTRAGGYGRFTVLTRLRLLLRTSIQVPLAAAVALVAWPFGKHRAARWLIRASTSAGELSVFLR